MTAPILPFRLSVAQYAVITQRCQITIRRNIRARIIVAEGTPYLIHPRELPAEIDHGMAVIRLQEAGLYPAPRVPHATAQPTPRQSAA